MTNAETTVTKYVAKSAIWAQPTVVNNFAIKQNTPIGATCTSIMMSRINMALRSSNADLIFCPCEPTFARAIPNNKAKTMICNILPSAIAEIGFVGKISITTSLKLGVSLGEYSVVVANEPDSPGLTIKASDSASEIAMAVVIKYSPRVLPPNRPIAAPSARFDAPQTSDTNTNGTTINLNDATKSVPPVSKIPLTRKVWIQASGEVAN